MMITVNSRKAVARWLTLAAAGVALSSHTALGAAPAGDVQAQARALLTGADADASQGTSVAPLLASSSRQSRNLDPQQQARSLILGTGTPAPVAVRGVAALAAVIRTVDIRNAARSYHGAQESAQRMILGMTE